MTTRSQGRSPQTDVVAHGTARRACRTRIVRVSRCGSDSGRARRAVRSPTAATAQTAAANSAGREMLVLLGVASLLLWALFLCFCFFGMVLFICEHCRRGWLSETPLRQISSVLQAASHAKRAGAPEEAS